MKDARIRVQPIDALLMQAVMMLLLLGGAAYLWQGMSLAVASMFGGVIVVVNLCLQRWHLVRAAYQAKSDAGLNLRQAYRCVLMRWLVTILLFVTGFAVLKLMPQTVMAGFILTQLALLFIYKNQA